MSPRRRNPSADPQDLVDAPFLSESERAEAMWLLASDDDPGAAAPSPSIARDYEDIEDMLGALPASTPDQRWHDDVLRRASLLIPWWRRPTLRWALGGVAIAAAALALIPLFRQSSELEVATRRAGEARGLDEIAVGDHLVVTARPRAGTGDLRVYLSNGALVASCPHGPACTVTSDGSQIIDIALEKPLPYQVILVVRASNALPDLPGDAMTSYLEAARAANARIVLYPPIDVH